MRQKIAPYWKSAVAFIAPAAPLLVAATQDASRAGADITKAEWVFAVATCVVTAAAVYAAPKNKARTPGERGAVCVLYSAAVFVAAVALGFVVTVVGLAVVR